MTPDSHRALYRTLLALYPRRFRREYGEAMAQVFADRVRDVGTRAWLRTVPDLLRTVPNQRIEALMQTGSRAPVLILALIFVGAIVTMVGVGGGPIVFAMMLLVGLVVSQRRLFASIPLGTRAPLRHAAVQTWWAPVATVLGIATLIFGLGTIIEASNWGGRIIGSSVLLAFGGAMILGLMRRPFDRQAGNTMILIATIPALTFFWIIVPTVAALVVWIGVIASGFSDEAAAPATT